MTDASSSRRTTLARSNVTSAAAAAATDTDTTAASNIAASSTNKNEKQSRNSEWFGMDWSSWRKRAIASAESTTISIDNKASSGGADIASPNVTRAENSPVPTAKASAGTDSAPSNSSNKKRRNSDFMGMDWLVGVTGRWRRTGWITRRRRRLMLAKRIDKYHSRYRLCGDMQDDSEIRFIC